MTLTLNGDLTGYLATALNIPHLNNYKVITTDSVLLRTGLYEKSGPTCIINIINFRELFIEHFRQKKFVQKHFVAGQILTYYLHVNYEMTLKYLHKF